MTAFEWTRWVLIAQLLIALAAWACGPHCAKRTASCEGKSLVVPAPIRAHTTPAAGKV